MAPSIRTQRLAAADGVLARRLFALMSEVFGERSAPLSEPFLARLLARDEFWAIAAFIDGELAGGLTAHTLPMTRADGYEVFLFDLAVRQAHQRRGVGRALVQALRDGAAAEGVEVVFLAADNEDTGALDFYRAIGGLASPVTVFTFGHRQDEPGRGGVRSSNEV